MKNIIQPSRVFSLLLITLSLFGCKTNKSIADQEKESEAKSTQPEQLADEKIVTARDTAEIEIDVIDETKEEHPEKVTVDTKVNWMSFEEAVEANKEKPKKLFIDVYTDWCGWCKVMDKNTFSHPVIAKYLNEKFYPVKLDGEQKEDINFAGRTFKFVDSGRGYHELAAALLNGKLSYPTVVFMDEDLKIIQPLPGYQKPEQFDPIIRFIGGDHFKNMSWQDFQKQYKSQL